MSDAHRFGGAWTTQKLELIAEYLSSYTTALKDQPSRERPFIKAYIDAFAGTGYRESSKSEQAIQQAPLFPDLAASDSQALLEGSARIALRADPPFDRYVFIEQSARRCTQLESLTAEFPDLRERVRIFQGEANAEIRAMCGRDWSSRRAVLFLDPYGLQVEWTTIEAIASTRAIDMWLLFPLGMGVNRLLARSGAIPEAWQRRLDLLLGTEAWRDDFYRVQTEPTLFGDSSEIVKATTSAIGMYFNDRLKTVFAGVAPEPRVLRNSTGSPLYLLCFAVGNPRGAPVALRIANHLLTRGT